ncbi:MAG: hypothetical protein U0744_21975 [Gemmataceae bacterium]
MLEMLRALERAQRPTRPVCRLAGSPGRHAQTSRSLGLEAGSDRRKLCNLYLSIMDRMGLRLPEFGDAGSD